jgi:hypothetical protein
MKKLLAKVSKGQIIIIIKCNKAEREEVELLITIYFCHLFMALPFTSKNGNIQRIKK